MVFFNSNLDIISENCVYSKQILYFTKFSLFEVVLLNTIIYKLYIISNKMVKEFENKHWTKS